MSDYYHTFLSSVSGFGDTPLAHPPPTSAPRATSAATFNIDENAASTSPQNGAYYPGVSESSIHHQPPKAQRTRRKPVSGPDHVKHRRTRSGCFTCRSRRVKCDETRPTCESEFPVSPSLDLCTNCSSQGVGRVSETVYTRSPRQTKSLPRHRTRETWAPTSEQARRLLSTPTTTAIGKRD